MHSFLQRSLRFHAPGQRKNTLFGLCFLGNLVLVAAAFCGFVLSCAAPVRASAANSGSIEGVITDPSGAAVAKATVDISDPVSGFSREMTTGTDGAFRFRNVPFNTYYMVVTASGFASYTQEVDLRSLVPVELNISLKISAATTQVTVTGEAADLIEQTPPTTPMSTAICLTNFRWRVSRRP